MMTLKKKTYFYIFLLTLLCLLCLPIYGLLVGYSPTFTSVAKQKLPTEIKSFNEIKTVGKITEYFIINTGYINTSLSDLKANGQALKNIQLPLFAILFKHEDKGYYLIDTGIKDRNNMTEDGNLHGLLRNLYFKFHTNAGNIGIDRYLESKLNNTPLSGILLTHLHFDHVDALDYLYNKYAADVYVSANEKYLSGYPFLYVNTFNAVPMTAIDFNGSRLINEFHSIDLFSDQSVIALDTSGHTSGHTSYLLNLASGGFLLVGGDVCHIAWNYHRGVGSVWSSDKKKANIQLKNLKKLISQGNEIQLMCGHEAKLINSSKKDQN